MAIAHAVVGAWLGIWNNKKTFLNATNLSADAMTIKQIFRPSGKLQRKKMVIGFMF